MNDIYTTAINTQKATVQWMDVLADNLTKDEAAELEKKYPVNIENKVDEAAVTAYEKATAEEEAKMAAMVSKQEAFKQAKVEKTAVKLAQKNEKLQSRFE